MFHSFKIMAAVLALLAFSPCWAEDTDLFVSPPSPSSTVALPNVLIIMDNTSNWNQAFLNERAALVSVIQGLPLNRFNIGLMMFGESGAPNDNVDGAYVRASLRTMDETRRKIFSDLFKNIHDSYDKGSNPVYGLAMAEAYRYFSGGAAYGGVGKVKRDYFGNKLSVVGNNASGNPGYAYSNAVYALAGNALADSSSGIYRSPVVDGCQRNFIIFLSNGSISNNDKDDVSSPARKMLIEAYRDAGGYDESAAISKSARIAISPVGESISTADEWALFMKRTAPASITTYTVDVDPSVSGQGPAHTGLLKSMASVSNGKYFAVSSDGSAIASALNSVLSEIQAINSAFASVSLPVSVNAQGTYLNQVFIGMFRPDLTPRWAGNLKQYKLGYSSSGSLTLLDASGAEAINSSTNFLSECARSFWTPSALNAYWGFNPRGECLSVESSAASDSPDGSVVEKGGQGYLLRTTNSRKMLTCSSVFSSCDSSGDSLTLFNSGNVDISASALGVPSEERTDLIDWARGNDVGDENTNGNITEARPSVHGDVVHSQPVALNYGTLEQPKVVVYYGGNDGVLRAVDGSRSGGAELWSFMAPEFYGSIRRLRSNAPTISYLGSAEGVPKSYGMDGAVTAYAGKLAPDEGSESKIIFVGMRRGGRVLYAFDVTTAASPSLLWKIGCPKLDNDEDCSIDNSIGQTWSPAVPLTARGYTDGAFYKPMLLMGGGYDKCEDTDDGSKNNSCNAGSKGRKVYAIDAATGEVIKSFDTERGVVAEVTVVNDQDGRAVYAYAADLGGNVYRITMGGLAPASWKMDRIASLGCGTIGACDANRKFMFAPEVVYSNGVYYLQIGSGDREKPLLGFAAATKVSNYFFNIADKPGDAAWLAQGQCDSNGTACLGSLLKVGDETPDMTAISGKPRGWYLELDDDEQVVTAAVTLFGYTSFNTHQPTAATSTSCTGLGTNRSYKIAYRNAAGKNGDRYEEVEGGGLSPSPVAGNVRLDDGTVVPFLCTIGCEEGGSGYSLFSQPVRRVYWNIEQ